MPNQSIVTDANYNVSAEAAALALARRQTKYIQVRLSDADKAVCERNASLLGVSQSSLVRGLVRLPIALQRTCLEAPLDNPPLLLIDTVTLAQGVNQIRRAGYNVDYTLHALNTLLAKPSLQEERKLALLQQASDNSLAAAKHFMATRELFAQLNELVAFELSVSRPARFR